MLTEIATNSFVDTTLPKIMRELAFFDQWLSLNQTLFTERTRGLSGNALIKARLEHMVNTDQFAICYEDLASSRHDFSKEQSNQFRMMFRGRLERIFRQHTDDVKEILYKLPHGWPVISEFGDDRGCRASDDAWLIVQHSDHDVDFQKSILKRLQDLATSDETHPEYCPNNLAYLYDRIQTNKRNPAGRNLQRYGTQGERPKVGDIWQPFECEGSVQEVDELRRQIGLDSLSEYFNHMNKDVIKQNPDAPPVLRFIPLEGQVLDLK